MESTIKTWTKRVLAVLNLNDEGKVDLMLNKMLKYYKEELRKAKANIETVERRLAEWLENAEEELLELKEAEETAFVTIDPDRIATNDSRNSYVRDLDEQFNQAIKARERKEKEIINRKKDDEATIENYKKAIEVINFKMSKLQ